MYQLSAIWDKTILECKVKSSYVVAYRDKRKSGWREKLMIDIDKIPADLREMLTKLGFKQEKTVEWRSYTKVFTRTIYGLNYGAHVTKVRMFDRPMGMPANGKKSRPKLNEGIMTFHAVAGHDADTEAPYSLHATIVMDTHHFATKQEKEDFITDCKTHFQTVFELMWDNPSATIFTEAEYKRLCAELD